jgi:hypothetical protein
MEKNNWKKFRFKAELAPFVWNLCESLITQSPVGRVWFYSDAQLSNPPKVRSRPCTLAEFRAHHDDEGVRFNTAITIMAG